MSTQKQYDFETEIKETIRKNLADLDVKLRAGSLARVICRDCKRPVEVVLTGEIIKTNLLGDIFDWMKIETPVNHVCLSDGRKSNKLVHMIYRLYATDIASQFEDRRWKAVKDLTRPRGTQLVTISAISPILEEDFRKGNIYAGR